MYIIHELFLKNLTTVGNMNIDLELWKFHDIFFDEASHHYTDSLGTEYTSVTNFVHEFSEKQDWDEIAGKYVLKHDAELVKKIAAEKDRDKKALLKALAIVRTRAEWDASGSRACTLGTHVHAFMENQWKRKHYAPREDVPDYEAFAATGLKAYQELSKRFVPIREEFIVCNPKWGLCGIIDFLAYDQLKDRIVILDYKTNKEIKKDNPFQTCIGVLQGLPDCNFIHYSAQLSTYKAILEARTSIRIGGMALIHIRKDGYSVIPCEDFSAIIGGMLDARAQERQSK